MPTTTASAGLTDRDRELLSALTRRIRVVTKPQIARAWWRTSSSALQTAGRRVSLLVKAGVLSASQLRAHPELPLNEPLWLWRPGDPTPPFGVLSYRLRLRWTEPLSIVTVITASTRLARLYAGSGGRLAHPLQVTHDLHVSAIYLRMLSESQSDAERWVSEQALTARRRHQKIPDAEIQDASGRTLKVIEFGGSYSPERVRMVHEDCEGRGVPYELW